MNLLAMAPAQGQGGDPTSSLISTLVMFGGIIFIFYFMMIRPQQKRQKEMQAMLESMQKGDKVVTSSGIHGSIASMNDDNTITVNVADNVKLTFDKAAIVSVKKKGE